MHMHPDLGQHWFNGMVSERPRRRVQKNGKVVVQWIPDPSVRNEPWDLSVYNVAMAYKLGLHKWSAQDWARLRAKLIPTQRTPDLFSEVPAEQPVEAPPLKVAPAPVEAVQVPMEPVIEQDQGPADDSVPVLMVSAAAIEEQVPASAASPPVEIAQPESPQPIASPAPLYPINPMQVRRRRIRSRGI